jgi:replicative DNA helicase
MSGDMSISGQLSSLDVVPPELVDGIVAWCYLNCPEPERVRAATAKLWQERSIPPEIGAQLVKQAQLRAHDQQWTRAQTEALADAAQGWEPPVPLSAVPALPSFPVGVYPPWLRDEVVALSEFTQTPADLAATIVLSVLAAALGGRAVVEVRPGFVEPVNLYGVVAMPPGSRKSPVHATLIAPVLAAEAQMAAHASARIGEEKTQRAIADKAAAAAQAAAAASHGDPAKTAEAIGMAALAESIVVPVMPRIVADDVTPESAASLLAEQGGRLAILSAEGGPFVTLAGRRYSSEPNLEVFLKGWSGDMLRVDRKGRPPEHIPHPALTLGLTVQPAVLKQIFTMPAFHGRGLLARVLYSMPPNTVGHRRVRTDPVPPQVASTYEQTMTALVCSFADWTDPARFQLTPGAAELFLQAAEAIEPRLDPHGGDLGHITEWAAKLTGTTARIAALLHAAEHLKDGYLRPVSEDTMRRAIEVGHYFTAHALAVFDFMGADPAVEDARAVLEWLRRTRHPVFTRRDLHRALIARFKKAEDLDPALQMLSGSGWIKVAETPAPGRQGGRPPSARFAVHPALLRASQTY